MPSVSVSALPDTGASGTVVRTAALDELGLDSTGTVFINTPSTTVPLKSIEYRVRLVLSQTVAIETYVVEAPLGGQHVQCLIGRDVLEMCCFVYDGPKRQFTLNVLPDIPET